MAVTVRTNGLSAGVYNAFSRFRMKRDVVFRYNTAITRPSANVEDSSRLIAQMHEIGVHPGSYDWRGITSYGGAIYSALQSVDRNAVNNSFPNAPGGMSIAIESPITWGGLIVKLGASAYFMTNGIPLGDYMYFANATALWKTSVYLGLNATRNVLSDLISKHGIDLKEWAENLHHIKLDKLTDSLFITSLCFPILFAIKSGLHSRFGGNPFEPYITSATICLADSLLQYVSRRLRGFDKKVATADSLRPVTGDLGALAASLISPSILASSFIYLLTRKVFAESYSGFVEGAAKRREKLAERNDALRRILDIGRYKVPDPYAIAAINLSYIVRVKSVTERAFKTMLRTGMWESKDISQDLSMIHEAMSDDIRIIRALKFVFPFDDQSHYRHHMASDFVKNRKYYGEKFLQGRTF